MNLNQQFSQQNLLVNDDDNKVYTYGEHTTNNNNQPSLMLYRGTLAAGTAVPVSGLNTIEGNSTGPHHSNHERPNMSTN